MCLGQQRSLRATRSLTVAIIALSVTIGCAQRSCLTNDCNRREDKPKTQKNEDSDAVPMLEMVPNEEEVRLLNQLSEFPFDYILKTSPELRSLTDGNPSSGPLLPMMEKMATKTKQNWIKKLRDFKRTEGNRNFQTQGW